MSNVGTINPDELRSYVERVERLNEEIKSLQTDRSDVLKEAKARGFDMPTLRSVIKARKMDQATREHQFLLLETYLRALGDFGGTPLGEASAQRFIVPLSA